jgi:hypothetical protein
MNELNVVIISTILLLLLTGVSAKIHTLEIIAIDPSEENPENPCLGGADINQNSFVDGTDLSILASNFGKIGCSNNNQWCDCSDINNDSRVDGTDLSILGRDFGNGPESSQTELSVASTIKFSETPSTQTTSGSGSSIPQTTEILNSSESEVNPISPSPSNSKSEVNPISPHPEIKKEVSLTQKLLINLIKVREKRERDLLILAISRRIKARI